MSESYYIGVDLGGTKTEILVIAVDKASSLRSGFSVLLRERVATPATEYNDILSLVVKLLGSALLCIDARKMSDVNSVNLPIPFSMGIPGTLDRLGYVKNANTQCLNGKPLFSDLEQMLKHSFAEKITLYHIVNDANCLALSESLLNEGAAYSSKSSFSVVLGTGVGGALVCGEKLQLGQNLIAGEWGHNIIPANMPRLSELNRSCYCGNSDCVETYLCGAGLLLSAKELLGEKVFQEYAQLPDIDLVSLLDSLSNSEYYPKIIDFYAEQIAACLAQVINIVDPEIIVLAGGLSNIESLNKLVEEKLQKYIFSSDCTTKVRTANMGDSSGVFGAALLPLSRYTIE